MSFVLAVQFAELSTRRASLSAHAHRRRRIADPPEQAERLIELDVHRIAGLPAERLRSGPRQRGFAAGRTSRSRPASALAPLLRLNGKPGFVVTDMADIDEFTPIPR